MRGDGEAGRIGGDWAQTVGCPACGEPNPGRARFCLACGDPLPSRAARPGGTRKAVTVVFSDLSGSTALGERLDPESLSQVMARYYDTMRRWSATTAARSRSSPATPSWPCSASRPPTRTTPCGPPGRPATCTPPSAA